MSVSDGYSCHYFYHQCKSGLVLYCKASSTDSIVTPKVKPDAIIKPEDHFEIAEWLVVLRLDLAELGIKASIVG